MCENGVCFKRPKQQSSGSGGEAASSTDDSNSSQDLLNDEKLARAKELIEKKRKDKEEEDSRVSSNKTKISRLKINLQLYYLTCSWQKSVNYNADEWVKICKISSNAKRRLK